MLNQDLVSYIQKQKAAGIPEANYRAALKSQGWSDEDITAASLGPIPTPSGIPVPPTQMEEVSAGDQKYAAWSFWLLLGLSIFHIIWLGFKNAFTFDGFSNVSRWIGRSESIIFLGIIFGLIILNFIPVLISIRPYRRGKYKKQLIVGIVSFIICQAILHVIIAGILSTIGMVAC